MAKEDIKLRPTERKGTEKSAVIVSSIIILTALWNGLVIKWGLEPDKKKVIKTSAMWHAVGFVIRLLCAVAIYLYAGWFWFWIAVILSWHVYDVIINLVRGLKWNHTGQNFFDKSPYCWYAKGLVLLAGLVFLNIPLSPIVGFMFAAYALLALIGFVLFWFHKPAFNDLITKSAKKVLITLGILLILSLLFDGLLFKDMPRITNYFK